MPTVGGLRLPLAVIVTGGAVALATVVAGSVIGAPALALPAGIALAALLVRRADVALGLLLAVTVLAESDPNSFVPTSQFFEPALPGLKPFDVAFIGVAASVALDCLRRRELPSLPRPIALGLTLLVAAMAMGSVTGYFGGATLQQIYAAVLGIGYLVVTPLLVVAVLRTTAQLRLALGVAAALIGLKALAGLLAVWAGAATI